MERQFKEKLKSIKTFEACLYQKKKKKILSLPNFF